jgi:hypothetical protein
MSTYTHTPHPHTLERLEHLDKPVKTADVVIEKATTRFKAWLTVKITDGWAPCGAPTRLPRSPS